MPCIIDAVKAPLEKLTAAALHLSAGDRARLAHALISSLDEQVDEDAEKAWDAEIKRRVKEIRSGKTKGVSASKVFQRVRARLQ
jgi:putative addiction module component (TIGR02574 family)